MFNILRHPLQEEDWGVLSYGPGFQSDYSEEQWIKDQISLTIRQRDHWQKKLNAFRDADNQRDLPFLQEQVILANEQRVYWQQKLSDLNRPA